MELRISARHFELTPEIREYSEDKIFPLKKYYQHVIDASLILTLEKHRHQAELSFLLSGKKMFAKSETDDIYVSIDDVSRKMERMLRDYHDKLNHHKGSIKEITKKETIDEFGE
ncbi:ribosome-associated translation inhibitor RaiA [bacterium]|nr:ribosome-associated translation inhibitor RaiA [bacterium]